MPVLRHTPEPGEFGRQVDKAVASLSVYAQAIEALVKAGVPRDEAVAFIEDVKRRHAR